MSKKLSYDTKTIITVVLLVSFYPAGVFFVYRWMDWPTWLKVLITLPLILGAVAFIILGPLAALGILGLN